jgi:hypothetical protein
MLAESFVECLAVFDRCFTSPTYRRFLTLLSGWLLCIGKHTVTGVIRAAGAVGKRHHSGYHRFFSRAVWCTDKVGLTLMRLLLSALADNNRDLLSLDDTLARHTGKHIAGAAMHRDPLLSTATNPFFHFGHNWVVLAVVVAFPRFNKVFSLPVLVRLYRTEKLNTKLGRAHRKKTELALELLKLVAETFPQRRFHVVSDNAYVNRSVLRPLPKSLHLTGRARMDAALYAPPKKRPGQRGRPRVRGDRLLSPAERAQRCRWRRMTVYIYGKKQTVSVQVFDALWYIVTRERLVRFVLIRNWPGHDKDDVLVTTDLSLDARTVIQTYCCRWSLEETFGWVKSRLGFEHPQNRTEPAVERTAPMALWSYSLVVFWYAQWMRGRTKLPFRTSPWYTTKTAPSFADMLATLRRQSWAIWISDHASRDRLDQKHLAPLLEFAAYAAGP